MEPVDESAAMRRRVRERIPHCHPFYSAAHLIPHCTLLSQPKASSKRQVSDCTFLNCAWWITVTVSSSSGETALLSKRERTGFHTCCTRHYAPVRCCFCSIVCVRVCLPLSVVSCAFASLSLSFLLTEGVLPHPVGSDTRDSIDDEDGSCSCKSFCEGLCETEMGLPRKIILFHSESRVV